MGKFYREKKSPDKESNDIEKFLKEAFSLYAWCIHEGPNSVGDTFKEYFGSNEVETGKFRERMENFSKYVDIVLDYMNNILSAYDHPALEIVDPLVHTFSWCIHAGDRIIWKKIEENDETWKFKVTYWHKPMKTKLLFGKDAIDTEYNFEEVWTIGNNGEDKVVVIDIENGKDIRANKEMESGDFEMPGKKMGRIIKDKKWYKKLPLPSPFD